MFLSLLFKEFREQLRTYRLWILGGVLLISGMLSPLLARYTPILLQNIPGIPAEMVSLIPEPTILDSFAQYLKNGSQFGLIVVVVLTMGIVAQEFERGTIGMLLTKPVYRPAILFAKWSAAFIGIVIGVFAGAVGFAFYTLVLFGPFAIGRFLLLNGLLIVFLAFYMTFALLASTLSKTQSMAAAVAFGGLLLLLILDSLPVLGDYFPGQLLNWGGSLFSPQIQYHWTALFVSIGLIVVFFLLAAFRFQNEEIL